MYIGSPVLYADTGSAPPSGAPPAAPGRVGEAGDGPGFFETVLDIINPLQHIPIVSTIYREITGDDVVPAARLMGGALFGGPIGFVSALVNAVVEQDSGRDIGEHALALLDGGDVAADQPYLAEAGAAAPPGAAEDATGAADIVWSGPRVVASLARPAPGPVLAAEAAGPATPAASPATAAAEAGPAWLGTAMADARNLQRATQHGAPAGRPEAQPWVASAMRDALDKYEAMARLRANEPGQRKPGASAGPANDDES